MEFFKNRFYLHFTPQVLLSPILSFGCLMMIHEILSNAIESSKQVFFGIFPVSLSVSSFSSNRMIILTSMMENIELILSGAVGRLSF